MLDRSCCLSICITTHLDQKGKLVGVQSLFYFELIWTIANRQWHGVVAFGSDGVRHFEWL